MSPLYSIRKRDCTKNVKPTGYQAFHIPSRSRGPLQTTKIPQGPPAHSPHMVRRTVVFPVSASPSMRSPWDLPGFPQGPPGHPQGRPGRGSRGTPTTFWGPPREHQKAGRALKESQVRPLREPEVYSKHPLNQAKRNAQSD